LDDAVTAANGGTVYIMDTVTLTGGDYYYSVTFDRYTGGSDLFDDPMFVVDAPNNSDGIAYVTMTSATIDGEGIGTIIQVQQGRLRLRGNIKLQNAAIGVEVNAKTLTTGLAQAQVELNYAVINANVSVRLAAASTGSTNDMILASFGDTDIALNGVVSLAQGAYITVYTALTSNVTVECANPAANTEIATGNVVGGTDYTLTADDLAKFSYFGNGYTLKLDSTNNQIQLDQSKTVYLDGTAANDGNGTQASPYNSLTSALNDADANLIIVDGTTALSSGTYSGSKTIQRGANFTGTMFTAQSAMVTLSGLTISGRCVGQGAATGTILYATSGDEITLNGGVTLTDCQIAVDVAATTVVRVNQAVISAAQYSIRLDGTTNELILTPASGTGITGAIFLPSNELIRVGSTLENLTGTLTVQCANASLNTAIAAGADNYTMTAADAQRVVYQNGIYRVALDSSANELALAEVGVAYLNGTATANGIGTAEKPYNNLSDAADNAGSGGTVIVTGTVTITESMSLHDTVTIQRGGGFTGTMFNINAPDNSYGVAYVTFTTATIDGGGTGTVFQVAQGRLRLRGSVEVLNASTAVDLTGNGQAEINYATIKASLYAVKVGSSSNQLILDSFGTDSVSIDGEIYLDTGATITVNSAITCELDLECHTPSAGLTIATAGNDYTLTQHDADYITYINHAYGVVKKSGEDALMLANIRYLDGTASRDGTGTQARPYNNLTSALNAAGENDMIVVLGTVTVTSGTYDKAVTIQRSETLSGTMFTVSGTVTLSSMVITGRGSGTDVTQTSGSLTLNGGVTLINCDIAVDAVGGTLYYRKAVVEGRQYSLRIGAATGNCYLQLASPMSASSITGTVYLGADRMLVLPSGYNIYGITGYITLVCQDPYIGRRVVSMDGSIYGQQDMAKVRYEGGAYSLVLNGTTRIDLAAAT
jgi:hypothetical protein